MFFLCDHKIAMKTIYFLYILLEVQNLRIIKLHHQYLFFARRQILCQDSIFHLC